MSNNLTFSWPSIAVSAVFTAAVLGGYAFYVHAVLIPAEDLAVQQRDLTAQVQAAATQREAVATANTNTMALVEATQTLARMAMSAGAANPAAADSYGRSAPAFQPSFQPPGYRPASYPPSNYYADSVRLALPPTPAYTPRPTPGIVTYNYTYAPPQHWQMTMPQVLTTGFYGYQQNRFGGLRNNGTYGRQQRR